MIEIYGNPREHTGTHIWYFNDTRFTQKLGLKSHVTEVHKGKKPYVVLVLPESQAKTDMLNQFMKERGLLSATFVKRALHAKQS